MARPHLPRPALLAALAVLGTAAVAASFAAGRALILGGDERAPEPAATAPRAASPAAPALPEGFVAFSDDDLGLSLGYPRAWRRLKARDPEVTLLVRGRAGASLQVRVTHLGVDVDAGTLDTLRAITDRLVSDSAGVELLRPPRQIRLAGLPGVHYFYSFDAGERTGVHSHYFLFDGSRMIALVFQAVPARRFVALAGTFDLIASTLAVEGRTS